MFFLAYIILPALILGNLILAAVNISQKKMHPIAVFICITVPPVVYCIHSTYFPEELERQLFSIVRYPNYILVQSVVNALIFAILKFANSYEKNPRRNYYRDKEEEPKEGPFNEDLLDS